MNRKIALLRAVNVGGRKVVMAELADLFERLGLGPAKTLQAAGSVVFAGAGEARALEDRIEAGVAERFGLVSAVLVTGSKPVWPSGSAWSPPFSFVTRRSGPRSWPPIRFPTPPATIRAG
jgi:hypothetical protein